MSRVNERGRFALSAEPLNDYCDCLSHFATEVVERVGSTTVGISIEHVRQLVELGLIRAVDASSYDGPQFLKVQISPAGAVALVEWQATLRSLSSSGRLLSSLEKLLWLLVGAAISLSSQLLLS